MPSSERGKLPLLFVHQPMTLEYAQDDYDLLSTLRSLVEYYEPSKVHGKPPCGE
jgi:hypothetical protein